MTDQEDGPGRQPPHDLTAERYTLGSMLWSPHNIDEACELIGPEDYYKPAHAMLHRVILEVQASGVIPDPYAVQKRLLETGEWKQLPNTTYLSDIAAEVPTTVGNTRYYATAIKEKAEVRRQQLLAIRLHQATEIEDPQRRTDALAAVQLELAAHLAGSRDEGTRPLDWTELLDADYDSVEFLTEPLLQPGGQIALVGDGKSGKSLFSFEWALSLSNGRPFLGKTPDRPYRCMIIDEENPHPEIQRRTRTLGYHAPELLRNLTYLSFPHLPPLDTPAGAAALVSIVEEYRPEVLWLDTISRMIQGEENTADTWLQLYRLSLVQLKARGISTVRLDHLGKDRSRGSRGSSAKTQDVDHVWELSAIPGGRMMQLRRTHSRNGIGPSLVVMQRLGHPEQWGTTTHQIQVNAEEIVHQNAAAITLARQMDEAGLPRDMGGRLAKRWVRDSGGSATNSVVEEAVRIRKSNPEVLDGERVVDTPHPGHDPLFDIHSDGTEAA